MNTVKIQNETIDVSRQSKLKAGDLFGYWKVLEVGATGKARRIKCLCTGCNKVTRILDKWALLRQTTKSCGCKMVEIQRQVCVEKYGVEHHNQLTSRRVEMSEQRKKLAKNNGSRKSTIDLGKTYGHWTVLSTETKIGKPKDIQCQCICGTVRWVDYCKLLANRGSCGCKSLVLRQQTCQDKYGVDNYTQTKEYIQKSLNTNRDKYSANYHMQTPKGKAKLVKNSKKGRIQSRDILVLSNGKSVYEFCKEQQVPPSFANIIYRKHGEAAFFEYCKNYAGPRIYHTTERVLINILQDQFSNLTKYDKCPLEFKSSRRPDFRIEQNNRVLYINTDGLYDHSIIGRTVKGDQNYHLNLNKTFIKNNQIIFQFRENELRDKSEIVKSIVLNYFGLGQKKYNARELQIHKVCFNDATLFFEENHLMGPHRSSTSFGLYSGKLLVCCISIRKHKKDNSLEIARFASKNFTSVRGGFSKLLKHVERLYDPSKIISFCDMRYSTGVSYEKLGFTKASTTLGWNWTDKYNTYNRLKCRANMDSRKLSEKDHAQELKLYRIYDAGQAKYVKEINTNE